MGFNLFQSKKTDENASLNENKNNYKTNDIENNNVTNEGDENQSSATGFKPIMEKDGIEQLINETEKK